MSEQARKQSEIDEDQASHGSLTVEDDPDGTLNPADLAGSASSDDETVGYQPSSNEADKT